MKIHDVITESELKQLDEAPAGMGMFGRAGRKIASKLGHTKSTGVLDAGNDAIALRKEFNRYLGKTGQQPNSEALLMFLQSSGYPTQGVEKIIAGVDAGAPTGVLGKGSAAASQFRDKMSANKAGSAPSAGQPKIEPTGDIEIPKAGGDAAATTTTTDKATGEPVPTGGIPSTSMDPLAAIRRNAGLPAAGSDTPPPAAPAKNSAADKAARMAALAKSKADTAAGAGVTGAIRKGRLGEEFDELDEEDAKVLPSSVIDQALLRAVQDSYKLGAGQNINTGAGGTTPGLDKDAPKQGALGKFGAGFKAGMAGDTSGGAVGGGDDGGVEGSLNTKQLSTLLPGLDPSQLKTAVDKVIKGGNLTIQQQGVLAQAFTELIKADPNTTVKAMNLLKRVSAGGA